VAAVHDLEKSDLGVTREVNVLRTIGDQLHQPPTCHLVITMPEKIIFWKVIFPTIWSFSKVTFTRRDVYKQFKPSVDLSFNLDPLITIYPDFIFVTCSNSG
jgi:hypothetical protein